MVFQGYTSKTWHCQVRYLHLATYLLAINPKNGNPWCCGVNAGGNSHPKEFFRLHMGQSKHMFNQTFPVIICGGLVKRQAWGDDDQARKPTYSTYSH